MTRKEAERQTIQMDILRSLGFTRDEAEQLRRISMTLRRWFELECGVDGGCIERDEMTGRPHWTSSWDGKRSKAPIADRETGARKRLTKILAARNKRAGCHPVSECQCSYCVPVSTYVQTDPRGASLYILRPGDVPEGGDPSAYYTRGICVY